MLIMVIVPVVAIIVFTLAAYLIFVVPIKITHKKIREYSEICSEELRKQGVNTSYENYKESELYTLYDELNQQSNNLDFRKDWKEQTDIGCRVKFIEDILAKRGLQIPEWKS